MQCVCTELPRSARSSKNFKGCVVAACKERYGHRVLLAIFDSVTTLSSSQAHPLGNRNRDSRSVVRTSTARRFSITWCIPRHEYFLQQIVDCGFAGYEWSLKQRLQGDNNEHSKKQPSDRYTDCLPESWSRCSRTWRRTCVSFSSTRCRFDLVRHTLQGKGPKDLFERIIPNELRAGCYAAITAIAQEEFIPMNEGQLHLVEDLFTHLVITKIMRSDPQFEVKLSDYLADLPAAPRFHRMPEGMLHPGGDV
ncbi:hypothetical protein L596_013531 [Steinernema carpocapsae]|uniref:Uncharacterized protein n=1 Tax=Steinernema carpocapsae TaxID=34508 RepID=A0A4U5P0F8_STECR|nr:hypothetical protein L596_013531 [Steinernema carpocapsae]